jgi:hypothetical protein
MRQSQSNTCSALGRCRGLVAQQLSISRL